MSVNAVKFETPSTSVVCHYQVEGRFSKLLPQIARNLNKIALPAVALFALSNFPTADGGPLSYGTCVAACLSLAGPAIPPCITACIYVGLCPWLP